MTDERIRILHMINGLGRGGAEGVLARFLQRSDQSKYLQTVISLTAQADLLPIIEHACDHVEILGMTKRSALFTIPRLVHLVRKLKPDLVQCWMYQSNFLGGLLRPWLRTRGMAWGIHHSTLDPSVDKFMTRAVARASALVSRRADRIISCSQSGLDYHASIGYPRDRLIFIPNGFDMERFKPSLELRASMREELELDDEDFVIGTVARYHPTKGYSTLIQAAQAYIRMNRNVHFIMVGRDVTKANAELSKAMIDPHASKRLHLLGERTDIERIMSALDVYTSASYSEAFSVTIGEAMSSGIPCVVTNVGDSALLVGDTGFVVEPRIPQAMLDGWQYMARIGQEGRAVLGEQARARIIDQFSLDRYIEKYLAMVEEILGSH